MTVAVPLLQEIAGWSPAKIRTLFDSYGLALQDRAETRTDSPVIR